MKEVEKQKNWFQTDKMTDKEVEEFDKLATLEGRSRTKHVEIVLREYLDDKM